METHNQNLVVRSEVLTAPCIKTMFYVATVCNLKDSCQHIKGPALSIVNFSCARLLCNGRVLYTDLWLK
jgi:hypothetical protein